MSQCICTIFILFVRDYEWSASSCLDYAAQVVHCRGGWVSSKTGLDTAPGIGIPILQSVNRQVAVRLIQVHQ
jgi:hypothetical protein